MTPRCLPNLSTRTPTGIEPCSWSLKWVRIGSVIGRETAATDGKRRDAKLQAYEGILTQSLLAAKPPQSVLKTVSPARGPWVRIPVLPPSIREFAAWSGRTAGRNLD